MKRKLYSNVIEQHNAKQELDRKACEAKKHYKLGNDKEVVVLNESNRTRLLKIIFYKLEGVVRILVWGIIMVILSVGATVLVNPSLREQLLTIFN
ncbi:MAG: hypothetical protein ACRC7N_01490 [Clostridium sp.]